MSGAAHHTSRVGRLSSHGDREGDDSSQRRSSRIRSRVSRACDRCKGRKTRCSGKYPCARCSRLGLGCTYTASYRRGRLPSIEMETDGVDESMARKAPDLRRQEDSAAAVQVDEHRRSSASADMTAFEAPGMENGMSAPQSSRNSPDLAQIDRQGHYVGPASGASFLIRVQRKLRRQHAASSSSEASIFTFGDLPLPELDNTRLLILPPEPVAESLVARYFEFVSATHRYLHRGTVERWLKELYQTLGDVHHQAGASSRIAVLFMVFAHAENFPKSKSGIVDPTSSARYFKAAEDQLSTEKGAIRLTSVQARLAQCFYLLSHSRLNHCWSLFGTTAHLVLALGIHRKSRVDPNGHPDYVDLECRKRTFWCAYNLDTYLSAALGRPRTFHDEDIDQEMPLCVEDSRIGCGEATLPSDLVSPQSIMSASVAHVKLSRIVATILRDLYGIRPHSTETQCKIAARFRQEIDAWRSSVAYLVDADGIDSALFQPIFLRQRDVLNLACWHAQILVHRPMLINNFASLTNLGKARTSRSIRSTPGTEQHVQKCLEAAMSIVSKIDDLASRGKLYNTLWFSQYFAFSAVVVLYVYSIQKRYASPETYLPALHAAVKCQRQITSIAVPGSLAQRYGLVLQELRLEVLRHKSQVSGQAGAPQEPGAVQVHGDESAACPSPNQDHPDLATPQIEFPDIVNGGNAGQLSLAGEHSDLNFIEQSPGSSMDQIMGWGQFDSLVLSGINGTDVFLGDGNMEGWD